MALQICCDVEKTEQIKKAIEKAHPIVILSAEDSQSKGRSILVYSTCGINELRVGLIAMQNGAGSAARI